MTLGYQVQGRGDEHVVVLHGWFFDGGSLLKLVPYLSLDLFTYVFIDLRGYGKSKHIAGAYTVQEAAEDVFEVIKILEWSEYHLIGFAMSSLIAQQILIDAPHRVKSIICVTPIPAEGRPLPCSFRLFIEQAASEDLGKAQALIRFLGGQGQILDKDVNRTIKRWFKTSNIASRFGYMVMVTSTDISENISRIKTPLLLITGEHDAPINRADAIEESFKCRYLNYRLETLNADHFMLIALQTSSQSV